MKRRATALFLTVLLLMTSMPAAFAEMFVIMEKPITVTYNGDTIPFPDANPQIQNGRTLVPVRAIMERAKMTVTFDESTKTVTALKDDLTITMTLDNTKAQVNKGGIQETVLLDEPARLIEGRTFVPVRFIAESMGIIVNWNANGREVVMIDTDEWKKEMEEGSSFLKLLLNTPAEKETPYVVSSTSSEKQELSFTGLSVEDGYVASDVKVTVPRSSTQNTVFDGQNTGTYVTIDTDLMGYNKLLQPGKENDNLLKLAKNHKITLDIVADEEKNVYLQSLSLVDVMRLLGNSTAADFIGTNYVKMPLETAIEKTKDLDITIPKGKNTTLWDVLVQDIADDKMLYTQSAIVMDALVSFAVCAAQEPYTHMYFMPNKVQEWVFSFDTASAKKVLKKLSATKEIKDILQNIFNTYEGSLSVELTAKDGVTSKVETSMDITAKDMPLEETEGTVSAHITLFTAITIRKFDSYKDNPISLPKKVVNIEDIPSAE